MQTLQAARQKKRRVHCRVARLMQVYKKCHLGQTFLQTARQEEMLAQGMGSLVVATW